MSDEHQINEREMAVTEHIGELRKRLIWTVFFFVVFFILGFVYVEEIYHFFTSDLQFELVALGPGEIFWIYIMIASVIAITGTIPIFCLQAWGFVRPGLTPRERKVTLAYIPALFLLFILGLLFGYYIVNEFILSFLLNLSEGMLVNMFSADKYFRFLLSFTLPFAFFFEVPLIAMFLTSLGIITPTRLKKIRKYAYLVLVILGTMLSPPDFLLQLFVIVPLIVLYEIGIITSGIAYRKREDTQENLPVE
ncbi:twin-arginine translocase subunit TatC [Salirhabdus sp. Marseille-P4669]|uniref:twin-arginine translocase subunit TatC n=1 Tax=Salirhabdus sp. Marseille-P4669 TaxID=2042310 RepID=UPI000C7D9E6A|nr:twin-arginine translocase subunit TatC [Salirhabdus sp. Marseille-P4669]